MFDLLREIKLARQETKFRQWLDENILMAARYQDTANGAETVEAEALAEAFYQHLCGPGKAANCCYAPAERYCAEGKRLQAAYYEAVQARVTEEGGP
jgi:hypothetical protein